MTDNGTPNGRRALPTVTSLPGVARAAVQPVQDASAWTRAGAGPARHRSAAAGRPPAPAEPEGAPATRWPARGAMLLGCAALALLLGGFGGWATMTRIAGAVVAPGQVEVEHHRQIVQHPDGGVVEAILVHEGQSVVAGDPLIRLDGTLLRTELAIVEGQYFELLARRARLEAERADAGRIVFPDELSRTAGQRQDVQSMIDGQTSLFETRRATLTRSFEELDKQADQVRQQIEGVSAQSVALAEQRRLITQELADQESLLRKGLAQAPRVLALQREAANLDGQLGNAKAAEAQGESKLTEIDIAKLKQAAERREAAEEELRNLGDRELELAERRRALTEQVARLDIRAPASGVVYQLQVTTPRAVIRPADPVMYLIPQDRPLVIAARVAPINIDEVHVGQQVKLRFSAFSSRTTPEIDGVLAQVSADAVVDQASQMQYYRAEVTLPDAERAKLGDLALVPGMPAEVYIQTGERSPLAYLLKPFTDYLNRAFRET